MFHKCICSFVTYVLCYRCIYLNTFAIQHFSILSWWRLRRIFYKSWKVYEVCKIRRYSSPDYKKADNDSVSNWQAKCKARTKITWRFVRILAAVRDIQSIQDMVRVEQPTSLARPWRGSGNWETHLCFVWNASRHTCSASGLQIGVLRSVVQFFSVKYLYNVYEYGL